MGGDDVTKKSNTYSLLRMRMNEVEKSKKPTEQSSSKNCQNSGKSSYSSKTTLNKTKKKSPSKEKEPMEPMLGKKKNTDPNVPDRSFGDYFCSMCDSHMNSDAMWEAHITGKRHLKNMKKGDPDPKYEDLDVESSVKYEIRNVKDPIIGLSYIHEIRRKEVGAPPLYTCFLCQATFATVPMVVEHAVCMKHRLNYMKENSPEDYQLLFATNLKKGHMEPLVEEVAVKLENKFGRGSVKVKQERVRQTSYYVSKRAYDSDDDDDDDDDDGRRKLPKRYEEKKSNPSMWKAVDYKKRDSFKDNVKSNRDRKRSYSSDEEMDTFKRHDYTKRSAYDSYSSKYEESSPPRTRKYEESPRRDSLKRDAYYPRTPPPVERYPHSRSYQTQENVSRNAEDYPPASEDNTGNSDSLVLKDFVQKVYALPSEIFLKIALLKLENMEIKGINELSLLSKLINKAQVVLCNKLPRDVQAVLKQKMSQNSDGNIQKSSTTPPVMPQGAESSSFNTAMNFKPSSSQSHGNDLSFIKDFLNRTKGNADPSSTSSSVSQNIVPHQTPQQSNMYHQSSLYSPSYQNGSTMSSSVNYSSPNVNYPYNNSAPTTTASSIPGLTLTEENRDAQSSYGSYQPHQPHYPDPSSSFPPYRF